MNHDHQLQLYLGVIHHDDNYKCCIGQPMLNKLLQVTRYNGLIRLTLKNNIYKC